MKGIACYLPAWEFMLSLFHNSINCGHPKKSLFWLSQIKVMWTNSRISEFPLEKALSTAMSHLWLKCFCCLLQFVRNKHERAGFQCMQTKLKSVSFQSILSEIPVGFLGFAVPFKEVNAYGISLLCVSAKQSSCISLPLSFHSAHKLWMGRYKQGTVFFTLLLRECASCKCPFTGTVLG